MGRHTEGVVWVAYSSKYPYLPIACGDTARDLAQQLSISESTVLTMWYKYRTGKIKSSKYQKIMTK